MMKMPGYHSDISCYDPITQKIAQKHPHLIDQCPYRTEAGLLDFLGFEIMGEANSIRDSDKERALELYIDAKRALKLGTEIRGLPGNFVIPTIRVISTAIELLSSG